MDTADTSRIIVPHDDELKYRIVYEVLNTATSGHFGRAKTYGLASYSYWWPKLYKWVRTYVRTCETCHRVKPQLIRLCCWLVCLFPLDVVNPSAWTLWLAY